MQNNVNLSALAKLGLAGLLVSACVPTYHPPHCATCAPQQVVQYCYVQKPGYVLSQDKYDPNFVPCPPITAVKKANPDDPNEDDADDGDDDGDDDGGDDDGVSPSTGPQQSTAQAGQGANAQQGTPGTPGFEQSFSGGGRGAGAFEGGQGNTVNARDLL